MSFNPQAESAGKRRGAFTLVEMLAAMAITAMILAVLFGITQQAGDAWRTSSAKIEAFQGARRAFEAVTRSLSQATLNSYYDYNSVTNPSGYIRKSDLHFVAGKALLPGQVGHAVFFQTPGGYSDDARYEGMESLLNACGYFVRFGKDPSRPAFLDSLPNVPPARYRYRLMELMQPSQQLSVYDNPSGNAWIDAALAQTPPQLRQLGENIVALVILPRSPEAAPLAGEFEYDSRSGGASLPQPATQHQLPPLVEVLMVAIDENSAKRLTGDTANPPDFGVQGLFQRADRLESDLRELEAGLNRLRVTYRVFRTTVPLRNAKWSS